VQHENIGGRGIAPHTDCWGEW